MLFQARYGLVKVIELNHLGLGLFINEDYVHDYVQIPVTLFAYETYPVGLANLDYLLSRTSVNRIIIIVLGLAYHAWPSSITHLPSAFQVLRSSQAIDDQP